MKNLLLFLSGYGQRFDVISNQLPKASTGAPRCN